MNISFKSGLLVVLTGAVIASYAAAAYMRNGIYQTPLTLWRATADVAWHKQRPHENYGQSLSAAGLYEDALNQFKIVQSMPEDGSVPLRDLYREIGVVYFRLSMIDEAIVAWKKGLVYASYDPSLMNNLALAFLKKGQYVEAEAYAMQGLVLDGAQPTLLNTLGEVAMHNREYEQAADYFTEVLEINPDDAAGEWNAALAYAEGGHYEKAWGYVTRYLASETELQNRQQALTLLKHLNDKLGRR